MTLVTYICFRSRTQALRATHDWFRPRSVPRNLRLFLRSSASPPDDEMPENDYTEVRCPGTALLTVPEACRQLRISRWSLYGLIHQRKLKTIKIGKRRLIAASAVDDLIQQLQEEAD